MMAIQEASGNLLLETMKGISKDKWAQSQEVAAAFLRDDRVRKSILDILKKRNAIAGAELLNYKLLVYGRIIEERLFERITALEGIYSFVYRIADICISGSLRDAAREGCTWPAPSMRLRKMTMAGTTTIWARWPMLSRHRRTRC